MGQVLLAPTPLPLDTGSARSILPYADGKLGSVLAHPCPSLRASQVEPDQAVGQAIRSLRTRRKWSQTELSLRADVDRRYLSVIELGQSSLSVRMMFKLCDALDVAPSDLVKDVERRMRVQGAG
ncbi:helix-turn-helix domain-containing protein [Hydrogenophaga laconesensis]|uniref:helix-turn-helix domain-containing protein n=1 Tax=Hydrogenophaga laconesensis TaxID=1805971 RepID=UPI0035B54624